MAYQVFFSLNLYSNCSKFIIGMSSDSKFSPQVHLSSTKAMFQYKKKETILEYTNDQIAGVNTDQWRGRWRRGFNSFLTNLTASVPAFNVVSPIICGDSYTSNKICQFLIGNSSKLADMKWKLSPCASPMCECGESEETLFHFFQMQKIICYQTN